MSICNDISIPIKEDKTVLPTTRIVICGYEVDTDQMVTRFQEEKVAKNVNLLLIYSKRRKVTLRELQSLLGLLIYATGSIGPGQTFLRRLYDSTIGITCPHYKIRLTNDACADLAAWLLFMQSFNGRYMFLNDDWTPSDMVRLYTDAASTIGCAVFSVKIGLRCAGLLSFEIITLTCWNYFQMLLLLKCGGGGGTKWQIIRFVFLR